MGACSGGGTCAARGANAYQSILCQPLPYKRDGPRPDNSDAVQGATYDKAKHFQATCLFVQGNPAVSLYESVTVDVSNMPPDTTFTIFFIELANKPFGHVEYVADLHTRDDGSGEASFQAITLVAFAADNRTPVTSQDQSGEASGIQLEHLGMWFSSLQDAQKALNDNTLKGTIFDGGNPPLHAGPQAMTDGQTAPVF